MRRTPGQSLLILLLAAANQVSVLMVLDAGLEGRAKDVGWRLTVWVMAFLALVRAARAEPRNGREDPEER